MKRTVLAVVTAVVGALVVIGSVAALSWAQQPAAFLEAKVNGTASTPQGNLPHATLELSILPNTSDQYPGPNNLVNRRIADDGVKQEEGWPFYWPSTSFKLPAHSLVTIRITQYDGPAEPNNPYFADVHGTVDGTATYDGKQATGLKPEDVAHTFTIHQYPESGQPTVFLSVPIQGVPEDAKNEANGYPKPIVTEFSFITDGPGHYIWNCEAPCGSYYQGFGGAMQARGWMSGEIEVV